MDDNYLNQKRKYIKEKQENYGRQKLKDDFKKKLNTTMIGALSTIEKIFGYLWGLDKEGKLTKDEEEFFEMWQEAREEILDKGNAQLRAIMEELDRYTITQQRYHYDFIFEGKNEQRRSNF